MIAAPLTTDKVLCDKTFCKNEDLKDCVLDHAEECKVYVSDVLAALEYYKEKICLKARLADQDFILKAINGAFPISDESTAELAGTKGKDKDAKMSPDDLEIPKTAVPSIKILKAVNLTQGGDIRDLFDESLADGSLRLGQTSDSSAVPSKTYPRTLPSGLARWSPAEKAEFSHEGVRSVIKNLEGQSDNYDYFKKVAEKAEEVDSSNKPDGVFAKSLRASSASSAQGENWQCPECHSSCKCCCWCKE